MLRNVLYGTGLAALILSLTLYIAMPIVSQGTHSPQANSNSTPGTPSHTATIPQHNGVNPGPGQDQTGVQPGSQETMNKSQGTNTNRQKAATNSGTSAKNKSKKLHGRTGNTNINSSNPDMSGTRGQSGNPAPAPGSSPNPNTGAAPR